MNNADQVAKTRAAILSALPGCQAHICLTTGLSKATVSRYIKQLRKERVIRIGSYAKPIFAGHPFAIFEIGSGRNAPYCIKPQTNKQRSKIWRKRMVESGEIEEYRARRRARDYANRANYRNDPLLAAFFGAAA